MCWTKRGGKRRELGAVMESAEEEKGAVYCVLRTVYRVLWLSSDLARELISIRLPLHHLDLVCFPRKLHLRAPTVCSVLASVCVRLIIPTIQ